MRWLILVAVIGAIVWSANWSYHYVDNAVLITDFWETDSAPDEWGLVDFKAISQSFMNTQEPEGSGILSKDCGLYGHYLS